MPISDYHKERFYTNGFIKVSEVVPKKLQNPALRAINHSLGNGIDPAKLATYRADSFCPELRFKPVITDLLFESDLWKFAEDLTRKGDLKLPGGAQIALRFPIMDRPGELHPHIDGLYREGNRVPKGRISSFTLLAGVFLSDVPNKFWGNFTVWPGTHTLLEKHFREHGLSSLSRGLPKIAMPEPEQVLAKAGDVLLCHYQLAHTVVHNVSPFVRYAVFFRLSHIDHGANKDKVFTDIWHEWKGMRRMVQDND